MSFNIVDFMKDQISETILDQIQHQNSTEIILEVHS
ncbi:MAG: hypothetical protein ACI9UN_001882 [Granulosicoccus sp.]|jgi:hypothetical protein